MSISVAELGTGGATTTDATTNSSGSVSPTTGNLILLFFANTETSQPADSPTISDTFGTPVTWNAIKTRGYGNGATPTKRVSAWWGVATGGAGVITATCVNTQTGWFRVMAEVTGANTGTPIVQSQSNFNDSSVTTLASNLSGTVSTNTVFGFFGCSANSIPVFGSGFTSLRGGSFGTPTAGFLCEYKLAGQDTVDCSGFTSSACGGISFELAASGGLSTVNVDHGLPRGVERGILRGV